MQGGKRRWLICAHNFTLTKQNSQAIHFKSFYMEQIRQRTKAMLHIWAKNKPNKNKLVSTKISTCRHGHKAI